MKLLELTQPFHAKFITSEQVWRCWHQTIEQLPNQNWRPPDQTSDSSTRLESFFRRSPSPTNVYYPGPMFTSDTPPIGLTQALLLAPQLRHNTVLST